MRVAVIGAGISGLAAGYRLDRAADVVLYDAEPRAGGHAHTVLIREGGRDIPLDSGFLVFNERTYPGLVGLFDELGVRRRLSEMSFSVQCRRCALEFAGHGLRGVFAQPGNLLLPRFGRLLSEILRFFRDAPRVLREAIWERRTIGDYLHARGFGHGVTNHFLAPMGAAIWSSTPERMRDMPARFFVNFFVNHGLLTLTGKPPWYTVEGGSRTYVEAILGRLRGEVRLGAPARSVRRGEDGVWVAAGDGPAERFDRVVIATHPDQALRFLEDPSPAERDALVRMPYSSNETIVHRGDALLPRRRAARASWNVALDDCRQDARRLTMTYYLNRLQRLETATDYCVSLNSDGLIPEAAVIRRLVYDHPLFTLDSVAARDRLAALSGERRTHYAGAYLGWGFHEDGFRSGAAAADAILERSR